MEIYDSLLHRLFDWSEVEAGHTFHGDVIVVMWDTINIFLVSRMEDDSRMEQGWLTRVAKHGTGWYHTSLSQLRQGARATHRGWHSEAAPCTARGWGKRSEVHLVLRTNVSLGAHCRLLQSELRVWTFLPRTTPDL